jgi:tetratricopeptide (TPR) repeat protein
LTDYNRAIALKPDFTEAYTNRAVIKAQVLNDLSGALQDLSYSIKLNPKSDSNHYNRGDILYMAGRQTEALLDFRQVRDLAPTGVTGLVAIGIIAMEQGQLTSAITSFNQAIATAPQFGDAYKYRGLAHRRQGNTAQAIQDWRKASQLYKSNNLARDYQILRGWLKELGTTI